MKREHNTLNQVPLPSGYTRLEYIEATGNQYINTGYYVGNKKTRIIGEFTKTYSISDRGVFFGCGSPNDNQWFINPFFPGTGLMDIYMIGIGALQGLLAKLNTPYRFDMTVDIPNHLFEGECFSDENNWIKCKYDPLGTIYNATLHLFSSVRGSNIQNLIYARLYDAFSIYENDMLVHNYIPALRDFDSKPGLYDVTAGEFKVNEGTGEFLYA